jgi:heme exporter protein A
VDTPAERAAHWLDRMGLTHAAEQRVDTYSRGMKQRLTIARALIHDPRIVLLDEPTTGLDQAGTRLVIDLFTSLRDEGRMLILITHDLALLAGRIDRLCVFKRGKLTFDDKVTTHQEILEAYELHA